MRKEDEIAILPIESQFRTSELTLISVLVCFGFSIEALDRDPKTSDRTTAIFKRSEGLETTVQAFWNREIEVEPIAFWETVRQVKGRIRAEVDYEVD